MWIDFTMTVTQKMLSASTGFEDLVREGHIGTHFDVMTMEFPLEFAKRNALIFDQSEESIQGFDLHLKEDLLNLIKPGDFVIFRTGMSERVSYDTKAYFESHPQLSDALIDALILRGVSMIGIDAAGIRRGTEHTPKDRYCAEHGVFVVENLVNLSVALKGSKQTRIDVYTFPVKFEGWSGLPCRVLAYSTTD